jgi:uncharacterized linocin/CFP29 family protein
MPNNHQDPDEAWSPEVWQEINNAVLTEVGRIRVAQKVFPSSQSPNVQYVPNDVLDRATMSIEEGQTKPFIEISVTFRLTQQQVNDEPTQHTGKTLAKLAAKEVAQAEDKLFFQGEDATLPKRVHVHKEKYAGPGLLNIKNVETIAVLPPDNKDHGTFGENTFQGVTQGISKLTGKGQPGPYALILESSVYADTYAPVGGTLATVADRLTPLLSGGFYGTGTLPASTGLLVSLGGEPTSLYVGQDTITAYSQPHNGDYSLRVFERVQLVTRENEAFVKLLFADGDTDEQADFCTRNVDNAYFLSHGLNKHKNFQDAKNHVKDKVDAKPRVIVFRRRV